MNGEKQDPQMDQWQERTVSYRAVWTGRGQGVATDGQSWFVTQNDRNPGISRYSPGFDQLEARAEIPRSVAGHVGAVAVTGDVVYVALEGDEQVITFDRDLNQRSIFVVDRPRERDGKRHLAWCAINPENGLLYTCDWNDVTRLDAYDPESGQSVPDGAIALQATLQRVQGGVFTPAGNVYLASDDKLTLLEKIRSWFSSLTGGDGSPADIAPGVHGFNASSGALLGYIEIPVRPHPPYFEEIEGLGFGPMVVKGATAHVHLSVLDKNHSWIRDDVQLKSYVVPDPDVV